MASALSGTNPAFSPIPPFTQVPYTTNQVGLYSAQHLGVASPTALYTLWSGANDLAAGVSPITAADRAQNPPMEMGQFPREADAFWRSDWLYLATTASQHVAAIDADVAGLGLPKPVIDKIYHLNARRVFGLAK